MSDRTEKVLALTTFLDGRERFEKGRVYEVSRLDARRFSNNGWVAWEAEVSKKFGKAERRGLLDRFRKKKTESVTLSIDNGRLGHKGGEL